MISQSTLITAQNRSKIDSLGSAYKNATADSTKANRLLEIAVETYITNPDTAIVVCKKALEIAQNANMNAIQADCYAWLAYLIKQKGRIEQALDYNHKGLLVIERIVMEKSVDGSYVLSKKAIHRYKVNKAGILNNIAVIYRGQGDNEKALQYFQMSLSTVEEIDDKMGMGSALNNIGYFYERNGDLIEGLEYYTKSLRIREEIGDKKGQAESLNNIGAINRIQGNLDKALEYYKKSLKLRLEIGWKQGQATSLNNIGHIHSDRGNYVIAKRFSDESLVLGKELGFPEIIKRAAKLNYEVTKKLGDYEVSLEMYELFIKMRDSISNEKNQKAAIRLQTQYAFEKEQLIKEHEEKETSRIASEERARRDNLQYSIVLIGLLIIGMLVAMLGRLSLPIRVAEGIIFFSFLLLFEFLLVLADPYIDRWSGGAPGIKLLFNAGIASLIFPIHSLFESRLTARLQKATNT